MYTDKILLFVKLATSINVILSKMKFQTCTAQSESHSCMQKGGVSVISVRLYVIATVHGSILKLFHSVTEVNVNNVQHPSFNTAFHLNLNILQMINFEGF